MDYNESISILFSFYCVSLIQFNLMEYGQPKKVTNFYVRFAMVIFTALLLFHFGYKTMCQILREAVTYLATITRIFSHFFDLCSLNHLC